MKKIAFIIIGFLTVTYTNAQSLEAYILEAERNSPEIQSFEFRYDIATEKVNEVNVLPNTDLSTGYFVNSPETRTGPQKLFFSVKQMIPWFGTITARKNYTRSLADTQYEDLAIARRKLALAVSQSYYRLYAISEKQMAVSMHIELLVAYEKMSLASIEVGNATAVDVLRIQIKQDEMKLKVDVLEQEYLAEQSLFNNLLNRKSSTPINIYYSLTIPEEDLITGLDKLELHPELLKYDRLYESINKSELLNQKESSPNLGLGLDYITVSERPNMDFIGNGKDILMPSVHLSIPIFNSKHKSKTRQNKLRQKEINAQKEDRKNQLQTLLDAAIHDRNSSRISFDMQTKNLKQIDNIKNILINSYETKQVNLTELLSTLMMQLKYELNQIESIKTYYTKTAIINYLSNQTYTDESVENNLKKLPEKKYTLTINKETVNKAGKEVTGMTINGTIPGPTIEFTEGEYAVIYVKNNMDVETSIHWHGILLPNFYDGVPYLTTPPIKPGQTQKYEFTLRQSGTYWYHSHTMLQEQSGVFGSIVIHPKKETLKYDKELVLMLSDWTNEKPRNVLRNLKRGTEWYGIKKGTSTPLNQVIARGAFGAQLNFWKQRMEGADIADIYYPAFLINGEQSIEYPDLKPGDKVRLRIIDGSASTSFWMTFGSGDPILVSADGKDIVPIKKNKTFIGVAETYDFIVTIPESGKIEFRITAQDGSGTASAFLGKGEILKAAIVEKPDKIKMMQDMAKMDMKMGAHALKFRPKKDERFQMRDEYGMKMMGDMGGMKMDDYQMTDDEMQMEMPKDSTMNTMDRKSRMRMKMKMPKDTITTPVDTLSRMKMKMPKDSIMNPMYNMPKEQMDMLMDTTMNAMQMEGMDMYSEYNYNYLKSPERTSYSKDIPVKKILLNLTGNMGRYIWSMNGVPLSETDKIKIKGNQVTRITLNNLTMMHHPMHLHGHFFRVINKNGAYSPLKHTVNIPPMEEITIEFYGNEYGDWFFHCHILYHMMAGMARVFSYDTPRDARLKGYPVSNLISEMDEYYSWGMIDAASHMTELSLTASNLRNQFNATFEYGWNKNLEAEVTYERYLHDYLRVFAGVNIENETPDSLNEVSTTAVAGIRYLTPYLFNLDLRIDNELRSRIALGRDIMLFPKFSVFGYYEYQLDLGIINDLEVGKNYQSETVWKAGFEYMMSRNFSLMGSYDNRYGAGSGLSIRF